MARMGRPGLFGQQKAELLGKHAGSIHGVISLRGGIAPTLCKRTRRCLTIAEREAISRGLAAGLSMRSIANELGRAPSTISREIRPNQGAARYRAVDADDKAWRRAMRPKACLLAAKPYLCEAVASKPRQN